MRVLIDGLDLTGKTTLVHHLITELGQRGVPARSHTWMLSPYHPLAGPLRRLPRVRQPDSALLTAALLGPGYLLDALLVRLRAPEPPGTVLIQDGYADRTVAFGMAGGPYLAACLALRWPLFAPFDAAVYLHAPRQVRAARLAERADPDPGDVRSVEDASFAATFEAMLVRGMGRRHERLLVFDTASSCPAGMARQIADLLAPQPAPVAVERAA
ncbi:hypothetical protein [Bailinhaonella thermotolerans]|uniref:Thymidylate kinase n=1 Tax=Bailinhaonella thermotolerans TaxID=1070861 RepID=A0A3A4A5U3_9ACTN|nr:hypothetical protein [Bailinhaonella thermotolerans]RJL21033.1 hypothetical protein D5H75_38110 [Bailinhaonella thermotolerans]